MPLVDLTERDILTLAGRLEHAPDCRWSWEPQISYRTADGARWSDPDCTIPHEETPCTCGYFAARESAIGKLLAHAEDAGAPQA